MELWLVVERTMTTRVSPIEILVCPIEELVALSRLTPVENV